MARKSKRPYGTGCVYRQGQSWAIRWRESVRDASGQVKVVRRFETLKNVTKTAAEEILRKRMVRADEESLILEAEAPAEPVEVVTFKNHSDRWSKNILPKYRYSTQTVHECILTKHLVPRFGSMDVKKISTLHIQDYVAEMQAKGCAPNTIDQHHQIFSDVMRAAVKWYGLPSNPARGVEMPRIKPVRKRWAFTMPQAALLLQRLPLKARAMVSVALTTGVRRGELFALRWKHLNEEEKFLQISEAVYKGHFDQPKTDNGIRVVPVAESLVALLREWKEKSRRTKPEDLIFGTRNGKPENPSNVLRRNVLPVCAAMDLPAATRLTFRRTFSTWSHHNGVAPKTVAELMGHSKVQTQFIYIQGVDAEKRRVAELLAGELVRIGQKPAESGVELVN